ncbi:MAG: hypothetical protein ACFKPT_02520 [Gloeotrichia echinulata GP01]
MKAITVKEAIDCPIQIAIHVGKDCSKLDVEKFFRNTGIVTPPANRMLLGEVIGIVDLPKGCAIAIVCLVDCIQMTNEFINQQSELERNCGDWQVGRFAWKLQSIRPVSNIPIVGKQGLFNVGVDLKEELEVVA